MSSQKEVRWQLAVHRPGWGLTTLSSCSVLLSPTLAAVQSSALLSSISAGSGEVGTQQLLCATHPADFLYPFGQDVFSCNTGFPPVLLQIYRLPNRLLLTRQRKCCAESAQRAGTQRCHERCPGRSVLRCHWQNLGGGPSSHVMFLD